MKFWPLIKVLPVKTNFRFVRLAKFFAPLSMLLVLGALAATLYPPKPPCFGLTCGIDFKGGTVLEIATDPKPGIRQRCRAALGLPVTASRTRV